MFRHPLAKLLLLGQLALMSWMAQAGMQVHVDALGTVVGRREAANPGAKTLLLGSHIDTVRNAGALDGLRGLLRAMNSYYTNRIEGQHTLPVEIEQALRNYQGDCTGWLHFREQR